MPYVDHRDGGRRPLRLQSLRGADIVVPRRFVARLGPITVDDCSGTGKAAG